MMYMAVLLAVVCLWKQPRREKRDKAEAIQLLAYHVAG